VTPELSEKIARVCDPSRDGWTDVKQGLHMAEAIIELKPDVSVEIGVYAGKGLICMALAHKFIGRGRVYGIDPWDNLAAIDGMEGEHAQFWSIVPLNDIYKKCLISVKRYDVQDQVVILREKSETAFVPEGIGVLRIDGNHGPKSLVDVQRFAPNVIVGGFLYMDDVNWTNGPLENGADEWLFDRGWKKVGSVDDTWIFRRER
jgi:hypothetical protein